MPQPKRLLLSSLEPGLLVAAGSRSRRCAAALGGFGQGRSIQFMARLRWLVLAVAAALCLVPLAERAFARPSESVTEPPNSHVVDFKPVGARTAWAVQGADVRHHARILRSTDAGGHWSDVTPSDLRGPESSTPGSVDALTGTRAWLLDGDQAHPTLFSTIDSGHAWRPIGPIPGSCSVQFVNPRRGWCVRLGGAAGSETVAIYRTSNGGLSWRKISVTGVPESRPRSTVDALPFGCDKTVSFTSPTAGFASASCNNGGGLVHATTDGGVRWRGELMLLPPRNGSGYEQFTDVVAHRGEATIGVTRFASHVQSFTLIFHSTDAGRRWTPVRPPGPHTAYDVDIVTADIWRLTAGHTVLATNDAGKTWQTSTSEITLNRSDQVIFTTATTAWEIPPADGPVRYSSDQGRHWAAIALPR